MTELKKVLALLFALLAAPAGAQVIPSGPVGSLNYWGVGGLSQVLNPGLAGQCLTTQGTGSAPVWVNCQVSSLSLLPPINTNQFYGNVSGQFAPPVGVDVNTILNTVGYDIARPPPVESIIYKSNVGPLFNWQALFPGPAGSLLTSGGPTNPPFWGSGLGILPNSVTNAFLAQMPANTVKCNPTGSTANAQDCPGYWFAGTPSTSTSDPDQAPAINAAIAAANAAGGGIVQIPAGFWNLKSQIVVLQNVTLQCVSNGSIYDVADVAYGTSRGTMFAVLWGNGTGAHNDITKAAIRLYQDTRVVGCGFWYPNQDPTASSPIEYGSTIAVGGTSGGVHGNSNVYQSATGNWCANCYSFLDFRGSVVGLGVAGANVSENYGSPIAYGVLVNEIVESSDIKNNHFNSGYLNAGVSGGLVQWAQNNGIVHFVEENDWPHFINEQAFGYKYFAYIDVGGSCCGAFQGHPGPITFLGGGSDGNQWPFYIAAGTVLSLIVEHMDMTAFKADDGTPGTILEVASGAGLSSLQFSNNFSFGAIANGLKLNNASVTLGNIVITDNVLTTTNNSGTCVNVGTTASYLYTWGTRCTGWGAQGLGGAVTQATSRTTGVTLNTPTGAITMVSAAGSATWAQFQVTNSWVSATDTIVLSVKTGASNNYLLQASGVANGSFFIAFATTGGTAVDAPTINYAVIKGSAN